MRQSIYRHDEKGGKAPSAFFKKESAPGFFNKTVTKVNLNEDYTATDEHIAEKEAEETAKKANQPGGHMFNGGPEKSNNRISGLSGPNVIQAKTNNAAPFAPLHSNIITQSSNASGSPLDPNIQNEMGLALDSDFSRVKIHNDRESHDLNKGLNAQAFTYGNEVFFGEGKYNPNSSDGKHLLTHELVHVIQQKGHASKVQRQVNPPSPTPPQDIYYLDTNIFDQIHRGNTAVAVRLRALASSGAILKVAPYGFIEATRSPADNPMIGEANRLIMRELNITVGPMPTFKYRMETFLLDKSKTGVISSEDLQLVTSARLENAKIWSLEKTFTKNAKGIEKTFGVKIAPESSIPQLDPQPMRDYRIGRLLLNLPPITILPNGGVTPTSPSQPGNRFLISPDLDAAYERYTRLSRVDEVFSKYGQHVNPSNKHATLKNVKDQLGNDLRRYIEISNSKSPTKGTDQATTRARINTIDPIETYLTPGYMADVEELNRLGPHLDIFSRAVAESKKTGRISNAGIEALWEIDPKSAERLVKNSGVSRGEQRRVLSQVPGQAPPIGRRITAGFLLVVDFVNAVGPIVQEQRQKAYDEEVQEPLDDIIWWEGKGITPMMEGVNDKWWPQDNEWTTNERRIIELLKNKDLDYLSLTGIPNDEGSWLNFTIWASMNIKNLLDWEHFIEKSKAIKSEGNMGERTWKYKSTKISGTTTGHEITTYWTPHPELSKILNAAEDEMYETTKAQIKGIETGPGEKEELAYNKPGYVNYEVYRGMPQSSIKMRFKDGLDNRVLYTLRGRRKFKGFPEDSIFYVFPKQVAESYDEVTVPDGFLVVGGADYWTFSNIYSYERLFYQPNRQIMLAKKSDLVNVLETK